eukprot:3193606-Amphidinium_carterae.1
MDSNSTLVCKFNYSVAIHGRNRFQLCVNRTAACLPTSTHTQIERQRAPLPTGCPPLYRFPSSPAYHLWWQQPKPINHEQESKR